MIREAGYKEWHVSNEQLTTLIVESVTDRLRSLGYEGELRVKWGLDADGLPCAIIIEAGDQE